MSEKKAKAPSWRVSRIEDPSTMAPLSKTEKKAKPKFRPIKPCVATVTREGLRVGYQDLADKLGQKGLQKVLRSLTVTEKPQHGKPKHLGQIVRKAYRIENKDGKGYVFFPRMLGAILRRVLTGVNEENPLPEPRILSEKSCELAMEMYGYQAATVDYVCDSHLCEAKAKTHCAVAYLQMDTGLGKTRVAFGVVARLRVPTLVVVPTEAIALQWIEEAAEMLPGMKVAQYINARKKKAGPLTHDVVIVIINTVAKKDAAFMEGYGLIVFDECHELHSPKHGHALWLPAKYTLGLSATPIERPDGLDCIVQKFLGNVIYQNTIPGFDMTDAKFVGEVWCVEYTGHPDHCETGISSAGTAIAVKTIDNVNKDPHRTKFIAETVERLYKMHEGPQAADYGLGLSPEDSEDAEPRKHGVFVFAEHREQLPAIRKALLERFAESDIDSPELREDKKAPLQVSVLRGGVGAADLGKAKSVRIILATYGYARRGISFRDMTCLVLASPRRNGLRQILGRTRRRGSDQRIVRIVVDIVDVCTSLRGQFSDRKKVYKAIGYPVKTSKVSYEQVATTETTEQVINSLATGDLEELDRLLAGPTEEHDDMALLYE